jgi:hypothetical protein
VVRFGGLSGDDAVTLVNSYWSERCAFTDDDMRLHENPYYWAMCMLYPAAHEYDWTQDPARKDTPEDLRKRWYG